MSRVLASPSRRLFALLGLLNSLLLGPAGCAPGDPGLQQLPQHQQQYLVRLARVLDVPLPPIDWPMLSAPPRPRDLVLPIEEQQIDWLDLFALNECDLGALIGYRNSGLGRVLEHSERWLYERELLRGLHRCEPGPQQTALFADLVRSKAQQLPLHRYNALLGGPEWRAFVSAPTLALDARWDPAQGAVVEQALYELIAVLESPDELSAAQVYDPLRTLRFTNAAGSVRQTWRQQTVVLRAAGELLEQAKATPLCRNGQPTPRARHLQTVFTRYYIEQIQPQLSGLPHPERGWLAALDQLVTAVMPPAASRTEQSARLLAWHNSVFTAQRDSEFARWREAIQRHSEAWRWHFEVCGLLPKPPINGLRE